MGEAIRLAIASERIPETLVESFIEAMTGADGDFAARERAALGAANELMRRWIEHELQATAKTFGPEVVVEGRRYRVHERGTREYHTLCGKVAVARDSYRAVGVHNGPTVVPLELQAGLIENATPALAFSVTQAFAERLLRHYEAEMRAAHRVVPSRSTLERIGKRLGAAVERLIVDVEPEIRVGEPVVAGVHSISFGLDRTTVPMAETIAGRSAGEPRIRRRPPPVEVAYRMAYVGTVSTHDAEGRVLMTKRFAATPQEGPAVMLERIGGELRQLRARYGAVPLSVVQDGAPELWALATQLAARNKLEIDREVIDRYHVDERLAAICECLGEAGWELGPQWRRSLDQSDTAIMRIVRRLDELLDYIAMGEAEGYPPPAYWRGLGIWKLSVERQRMIGDSLEYFRKNRARIRYASSLSHGLPIGSGPTEGACKSVVTMRFKRSGQRWFESGLAPCLSLRALHLSERLRPCFEKLQALRTATLSIA